MNDREPPVEELVPDQTADHAPAPADPSQVLSPRRRTALVTYLAILFAIAFLFVALTMAIEAKRLKGMNEELQDSSQKTSASLTNNINALQTENQRLTKENEDLKQKLDSLEEGELDAEEQLSVLQTRLELANQELEALKAEKQDLEEQLRARSDVDQRVEDAITVSELLHQAMALNEAGDIDGLVRVLEQIDPLRDLLSPTEKDIYDSLVID